MHAHYLTSLGTWLRRIPPHLVTLHNERKTGSKWCHSPFELLLECEDALPIILHIGLKHAILIGFSTGLISFVPYLGPLTGLVISTCVAVAQFWPNWTLIMIVPATFIVGQSLADYILSPYFVGRRVKLNPVWVMFALFAFGDLFGFVGLLIAVPLAAAIGVSCASR